LLLPIGIQVPELRFSSNGSQQFSIKGTQALAPELSEVDTRPFSVGNCWIFKIQSSGR
jgi:hypothetical protein